MDDMGSQRPVFNLGAHDSKRNVPLTDLQYGYVLNQGVRSNHCNTCRTQANEPAAQLCDYARH